MSVKVLTALLISGAMTASVFAFPTGVTTIQPGAEVELAASTKTSFEESDASPNRYGSFVYALGDGTLKVKVPDGADKAIMWSVLFATNGVLTLDLTDVVAKGVPYYQYGGIVTKYNGNEGALRVKGLDNLLCGDPTYEGERFEMGNVSFVDANDQAVAGGVTFTNNFVLMSLPDCTWSLAKGGLKIVSLPSGGLLDSLITDDRLDVSAFNLRLIGQSGMVNPSATIRVGAKKGVNTYYTDYAGIDKFKTTVDNDITTAAQGFFWSLNGHGVVEQTVENDILLNASSATLTTSLRATTFEGAVSGSGSVTISSPCSAAGCHVWFKRPVTVPVTVQPSISGNNVFDVTFFDAFSNKLTLSRTNTVVSFASASGTVTSEIGSVAGVATALPAGRESAYPAVFARDGAYVKVGNETGWCRLLAGGGGKIEFKGLVYMSTPGNGVLVKDGEIVSAAGCIVEASAEGGDLSGLPNEVRIGLTGKGHLGAINLDPVLWLDASDAASVSNLWLDATVTVPSDVANTFPTVTVDGKDYHPVERWNDRRPSRTAHYVYNTRHKQADKDESGNPYYKFWPDVYPYVVPNGVDGKPYVSMATSTRRFNADKSLKARFVVMLFGSQAGGGHAILANEKLSRGGDVTKAGSNVMKASDCVMTNEAFKTDHVWLDGEAIDPTTTGFDGGWQIVSVKFDTETAIAGLGFYTAQSKDGGGQNYAEILFFDKELDDVQRRQAETYLALKWGLKDKYKGEFAARNAECYGSGELVVDNGLAKLGGIFSGKVTVADGAALEIPAVTALPTEDDVAKVQGRLAWFDPDQEGALKYSTTTEYTLCPRFMYDRALGGKDTSLWAMSSGGNGRAPSVETRAAGLGPARKWLQYANVNPTKTVLYNGNAMRMGHPESDQGEALPGVRTVMMVQDSCQGGGCPFMDSGISGDKIKRFINANSATDRKDQFSKDWTKPIWPATAANTYFSAAAGGETYLNGVAVDGAANGFTGGPEVLTAVAGKAFGFGALGGYAYKDYQYAYGDTDPHTDVGEIQGEVLLFDRVLSQADRQMVEAYLMSKWMGYLPAGTSYGSFAGLTLSGEGYVKVPSFAALPALEDFTGTLAFAEPFEATVEIGADGTFDPIALPQVDLTGTTPKLTVAFPEGRPARGWYTVVTAAGGLDGAEWTFDLPDYVRTEVTATAIRVKVIGGFSVIVR